MPLVDTHAPGAFCWIELSTTDQNAAKSFYTSLFGWTFMDSPMGPNDIYTMFQLEGHNSAAAYTQREDETKMGVPPHWNIYICVASADAIVKRAGELGGQVLAGPFDVSTHGRMAVIRDPSGAVFCIWEPKDHTGLGVEGQNASFCWADLSTPDRDTATKFYSELFGWTFSGEASGYLHIKNSERPIGGVQAAQHRNPHVPPHWLIYLQVDDCNASTAKAKELGANIFMGPMNMENVGVITVLADPQGAAFSLFQPGRKP